MWGWVSDHLGRENTMFIAFSLEAVAVFALLQLMNRLVWFIALSGLCFFAWSEICSLLPLPGICSKKNGLIPTMASSIRQRIGCVRGRCRCCLVV